MRAVTALVVPLIALAACSDSSSHAVVELPVSEPIEDPIEDPEVEPCDAPIIYQQMTYIEGRKISVRLPMEYEGRVTTTHGGTTTIKRGGEWSNDYSTTRGSVSVSVTAEYSGDVDCPDLGTTIEDHVILPGY